MEVIPISNVKVITKDGDELDIIVYSGHLTIHDTGKFEYEIMVRDGIANRKAVKQD